MLGSSITTGYSLLSSGDGSPASNHRPESSDHLYPHFPDFVFDAPVERMLAKAAKVRVPGQPLEIAVTQSERFFQSCGGQEEFAVERVATGKVVKHQRVGWFEPGQLLVHYQAVLMFTELGVMVPQNLEGVHVVRIAPNDPFHESDFDIRLARFSMGQHLDFGTVLFPHTTPALFPSDESKSSLGLY